MLGQSFDEVDLIQYKGNTGWPTNKHSLLKTFSILSKLGKSDCIWNRDVNTLHDNANELLKRTQDLGLRSFRANKQLYTFCLIHLFLPSSA